MSEGVDGIMGPKEGEKTVEGQNVHSSGALRALAALMNVQMANTNASGGNQHGDTSTSRPVLSLVQLV